MIAAPEQVPPFAAPFWEAIDRQRLVLPRCSVCARWQWYPEPAGTDCAGGVLVWTEVAGTGSLYTLTRVHRSFLPSANPVVPYTVGMVDLDGVDGPRLVAPVQGDNLRIGQRVVATFPQRGDHRTVLFTPIR